MLLNKISSTHTTPVALKGFDCFLDEYRLYVCTILNFGKKFTNHFELTKDDVERLEFILISSENVTIESPIQFVPLLERDDRELAPEPHFPYVRTLN